MSGDIARGSTRGKGGGCRAMGGGGGATTRGRRRGRVQRVRRVPGPAVRSRGWAGLLGASTERAASRACPACPCGGGGGGVRRQACLVAAPKGRHSKSLNPREGEGVQSHGEGGGGNEGAASRACPACPGDPLLEAEGGQAC